MFRYALAIGLMVPMAVAAAPQTSCPPLGEMPGYVAGEARVRAWEPLAFTRKNAAGEDEEAVFAGRSCQVSYQMKEGTDPMSDLEIQTNYRQQLQAMGAVATYEGGRDTYAQLSRGGAQTWFRVYSSETSIELTTLVVGLPRASLLPPSGSDYRLLGHMPGFVAGKPVVRNYDKMSFTITGDDGDKEVSAQGRTFAVSYQHDEKGVPPTDAETQWNYREGLKALGAELLFVGPRDTVARVLREGQVIWVRVFSSETSIEVSAVEEKPFEPTIKPVAAPLQQALAAAGRVALYVNFDFDRATLRPEAGAVVAQVAALLKAEPGLKLAIEGHTDAMGTAEHNRSLSAARAAAFAQALVAQGVAAERLTSAGVGPDKPVATNDTSEGRARNRRVELVRM